MQKKEPLSDLIDLLASLRRTSSKVLRFCRPSHHAINEISHPTTEIRSYRNMYSRSQTTPLQARCLAAFWLHARACLFHFSLPLARPEVILRLRIQSSRSTRWKGAIGREDYQATAQTVALTDCENAGRSSNLSYWAAIFHMVRLPAFSRSCHRGEHEFWYYSSTRGY